VSNVIEPRFRVAISDGRKRFTAVYGSERQLWERVQTRLKLPKVWPTSKIVPRRVYVESTANVAPLPALPLGVDVGTAIDTGGGAQCLTAGEAQDGRGTGEIPS